MNYSTVNEVRDAFWEQHPQFKKEKKTRRTPSGRNIRTWKTQNDYPCDIRMAWCDFVENTRRSGDMTESLANRVTL